jgi:hypothetical protein
MATHCRVLRIPTRRRGTGCGADSGPTSTGDLPGTVAFAYSRKLRSVPGEGGRALRRRPPPPRSAERKGGGGDAAPARQGESQACRCTHRLSGGRSRFPAARPEAGHYLATYGCERAGGANFLYSKKALLLRGSQWRPQIKTLVFENGRAGFKEGGSPSLLCERQRTERNHGNQ